jgi:hypothetical protein
LYDTIFLSLVFGPKILTIIRNKHNRARISPFDDLPVHKAIYDQLPIEEVAVLIEAHQSTLCQKDGDRNMAFQLALKYNAKDDILIELLRYLLPVGYDSDGRKIEVDATSHGFAWAEVAQLPEHVEVVEKILSEYSDLAVELATCLDFKGRIVEQIACPASQALLKRQRYFMKRFLFQPFHCLMFTNILKLFYI